MMQREAALETKQEVQTNPIGYMEIDADAFLPLNDRILVQWEKAHDSFKAGKIILKRPETHKGAHYTGTVLAVGDQVSNEILPGMRIFFEQFSGFEKLFDPKHGRLAVIREVAAVLVLPPRVKIESMDGDYDYEN